jgi:hypothetical protein
LRDVIRFELRERLILILEVLERAGRSMAARMAMMAITTSSSMRVKAATQARNR